MNLDHIINWRLRSGSHDFPGPDGGTCINEAAIVAAGFKYRSVKSWSDCPPCFSPVLAQMFINVNDQMSDALRQELLMPFVTRLAGTRDTDEVEIRRARFIAVETVRLVLPIALRAKKQERHALACAAVPAGDDKEAAANAANAAAAAYAPAYAANAANAANAAANAAYAAAYAANAAYAAAYAANAANAAAYAAYAANAAAYAANAANAANAAYAANAAAYAAKRQVWLIVVDILDRAMKIGNQAEPLDGALIVERMERAKTREMAL